MKAKVSNLVKALFVEKTHGWQVLPKRWIVERTFAWLNHSRRLSKNYELTVSYTYFVKVGVI